MVYFERQRYSTSLTKQIMSRLKYFDLRHVGLWLCLGQGPMTGGDKPMVHKEGDQPAVNLTTPWGPHPGGARRHPLDQDPSAAPIV